ncbi:MAG: DUF4111 domain-containing protein [Ruminococcaceae bacterium]|nr:DUF4111 domain-containing protein [Oscillospiraceae bacterium]
MENYTALLESYVLQCREILADELVGVYLHGSAAMGCFHAEQSDIDLLIVVRGSISDEAKRLLMDMTVAHNRHATAKGIEMSVVRRDVCRPFVHPTPFELHFSNAHIDWYRSNPGDYIAKMNGTDRDLAAHFTITRHRGITLWGEETENVFDPVPPEDYFDSIWFDIEGAEEDILDNPVYVTLNLCRVLGYAREGLVLSKREGGEWGRDRVPEEYRALIDAALEQYRGGKAMVAEPAAARRFARYMLDGILGASRAAN